MTEVVQDKQVQPAHEPSTWDSLGASLGGMLEKIGITRIGLGAVAIASAALISGCSPQDKSYWSNQYTDLPPPPPEARMQLGVSTEKDGTVFINYVVWDGENSQFARKDIHYTTTLAHPGQFQAAGGYKQKIHHGEVLYGDAIVDQKEKQIVLSNGNLIDGKSGNIIDREGTVIFER